MPRIPELRSTPTTRPKALSVKVAGWLLDAPRLGQARPVKRLAGQLLKQPARQGCTHAQRRLGQLLTRDSGDPRERRLGEQLLRQAARAGDVKARALMPNTHD